MSPSSDSSKPNSLYLNERLPSASVATTWTLDGSAYLPFEGRAREVTGVVVENAVTNGGGGPVFTTPFVTTEVGAEKDQVSLTWSEAVKGRVHVTMRVDRPI